MPPDRDLDRELRDLGRRLDHPPVPDLARSVRERLEAEDAGSPARPQVWWITAAAIVLIVAVPAFASILDSVGSSLSGDAATGGGVEVVGRPELDRQGAGSGTSSATLEERDLAGGGGDETAGGAMEAVKTPNDRPVPNVVGVPVLEACRELRMRGYVGSVAGETENKRVAPGHVVYQEPRAGRRGFEGQPVELVVSEPYPAGKLGRDVHCRGLEEHGPGGKPDAPGDVSN